MQQRRRSKARRIPLRGGNRERNHGDAHRTPATGRDNVKGEGNYKAAREFDEAERKFVHSEKLDQAIRNVAPKSEAEKREMEDAEERSRQRAKEEDPALLRKPPQTSRRSR
jgi:hypothetical protein